MSDKKTILVVEDEEDLRDIVIYNLEREGYKTIGVESGEEGLDCAIALRPDLIILDLMLPGMNGMDVCRKLKQGDGSENLKQPDDIKNIPIIMASAKGEEADIVSGLELGADDYVTKPFSPRILLARVRSVLRRSQQDSKQEASSLNIDGMEIDTRKFKLKINDATVDLTKSEFGILNFLASHRGWVFTRYQIVDAIRGEKYVVTERAIDVQIAGLRKKLGDYGDLIETVRGVGYRFRE
ncbi:MAG: response regulator transcription factor [Gammaproteobacteria bacterium]|nr:response regulator transcription factor [Gammaproteobacteria bacterium]MCW8924574.1 response regulator transcription factor [Gammaproteobacteria bacterium]